MKIIFLVLGLAVGFAGGIWYGISHPKEAADLNAKREEWVRQGKEEALNKLRDVLSTKLAQSESAPAAPPGKSFAAGATGGGTKGEAQALKDVKSVVEAQLTEVKAQR